MMKQHEVYKAQEMILRFCLVACNWSLNLFLAQPQNTWGEKQVLGQPYGMRVWFIVPYPLGRTARALGSRARAKFPATFQATRAHNAYLRRAPDAW